MITCLMVPLNPTPKPSPGPPILSHHLCSHRVKQRGPNGLPATTYVTAKFCSLTAQLSYLICTYLQYDYNYHSYLNHIINQFNTMEPLLTLKSSIILNHSAGQKIQLHKSYIIIQAIIVYFYIVNVYLENGPNDEIGKLTVFWCKNTIVATPINII